MQGREKRIQRLKDSIADAEWRLGSYITGQVLASIAEATSLNKSWTEGPSIPISPYMIDQVKKIESWSIKLSDLVEQENKEV